MTTSTFRVTRHRPLFCLALIGLLGLATRLPAEPTPGQHDQLVAQMICRFLNQGHLARPKIDIELSKRLFHRFLKDMDPGKLYFTQADIDEFKESETQLSNQLLQGDISFAYKVYERLTARLAERMQMIEELVKAPQDFTTKEYLDTDFDKLTYAQSDAELRDRWRKRIKFDLLLQRLGQKPLPEAEAKKKVLTRYQGLLKRWRQLDNYDLMELYLSDLTSSVDPHSSYMSPNTLDDFEIAMRLNLEGIGALLRQENGETIVAEILPGGAAIADGRLKTNDKIIAVAQGDDKFTDVIDMKLREVVKLIRGPQGTPVQLKVVPAHKLEPLVYAYTRKKVELKSQEARQEIIEVGKKPDGTPYHVGVIDLPSFYADTVAAREGKEGYKSATEDVRKILNDFKTRNVDGVILDLRHNGGGALTEALSLTGLFIDEGPVVQVKGSQGRVQRGDDPEKGVVYGGPLMVLVSKLSASASEILAGALQDYDRALVVGDSMTHGKGTVQTVLDLGSRLRNQEQLKLGALKLTIQKFYRVNGDSTQNKGVASDIVLPSLTEQLASGEKDLENALAFDHVEAADHEDMHLVPSDLKLALRAKSAARIKNSADFKKLQKEIEQVKIRKARKSVPLNEQELKAEFNNKEDAEKAEQALDAEAPEPPTAGVYKFTRNYVNKEVLQIMEDFLQAKQAAASR